MGIAVGMRLGAASTRPAEMIQRTQSYPPPRRAGAGQRSDLFRHPPQHWQPEPPPRSTRPPRPPRRRRQRHSQGPLAITMLVAVLALALTFLLTRTAPPTQRLGEDWLDIVAPHYVEHPQLSPAERQRLYSFLQQRHPDWLRQVDPRPGREQDAWQNYRRLVARTVADDAGLRALYQRHDIAFMTAGVMVGALREPAPAAEPAATASAARRTEPAQPRAEPRSREDTVSEPKAETTPEVKIIPAPRPTSALEAAL